MLPSDLKSSHFPSTYKTISKISNSLVESFVKKNNLTALKILFYISRAELTTVRNGNLVEMNISIKDLLNYTKIDFKTLRRNILSMHDSTLTFVTYDAEGVARCEENITIIPYSKITYNDSIELQIFTKIYDLIIDVKTKFTVIDINNLMNLNSKHSVRMIQLLEYIEGFGHNISKRKVYSLFEFNSMFGTNYKNFYELERKILIPVKSELDEFSNLSFLFSFNYDKSDITKAGRPKAVSVTIDLKSNRTRQLKLF